VLLSLLRSGKFVETGVEDDLGTTNTWVGIPLDGTTLRNLELLKILSFDEGHFQLALFYLFL